MAHVIPDAASYSTEQKLKKSSKGDRRDNSKSCRYFRGSCIGKLELRQEIMRFID